MILWSRLGTPLPDVVGTAADRRLSGTVWEYQDARAANKPVFLYRRTSKPQIDLDDPELDDKRAQYEAVRSFFVSFTDADRSQNAGFNSYTNPEGFAALLRQHLEAFVNERLGTIAPGVTAMVTVDDPRVTQILTLIDELSRKNRAIDDKDAEIARLRRDNEELRRAAIARTLTAAADAAATAAVAAAETLALGDTRRAEELLRDQERAEALNIEAGDGDNLDAARRAAELAREQGALAIEHDVNAAMAAYLRAAAYDPDHIATRLHIGDLQAVLGNLPAASESYRRAAVTADERCRSTPDDVDARSDLATAYDRIGRALLAQGDVPSAVAN